MDPEILMKKLESLGRCLARIKEKRPKDARELEADIDTRDIIVINLERAVQQCVDIGSHLLADYPTHSPATMTAVFDELAKASLIPGDLALRLARAVGFRNIAVHEYEELDWDIVQHIITSGLDDFESFAKNVLTILEERT